MSLKTLLVSVAVRLQFPPFTWLLQAWYHLAIEWCVRRLRRVAGVAAVYLTGSLASDRALYGLSDIDFKVFVRGRRDQSVYLRIREVFAGLSRYFPMLGPVDEKGIYFTADFARDYLDYPLIRHLCDERFYHHRLLWGEDLLPELTLPARPADSLQLECLWKLREWYERLCMLGDSPRLASPQRRYLLYKGIADAGLIWLTLQERDYRSAGRPAVLAELKSRLAQTERPHIDRLLRERHTFFRAQYADMEADFALFKRVMTLALDSLDPGGADGGLHLALSPTASYDTPQELKKHLEHMSALCGPITAVKTLPSVDIPVSPLDCRHFGAPTFVIEVERPLSLVATSQLRNYYRENMEGQCTVFIRETPTCLCSVFSELMEHWIKTRHTDDLLVSLAAGDSPRPLGSSYVRHLMQQLDSSAAQIHEIVQGGAVFKMEPTVFVKFLFASLRTLILQASSRSAAPVLPVDADAVALWLKQNTRLSPHSIDRLKTACNSTGNEQGCPVERLVEKARLLLLAMARIARGDDTGSSLEALQDVRDERALSISVVIITRSRSRQLARCLRSMLELCRPPDELIVVDNASSDDTAEVVDGFHAPFPVKYVREPRIGIATARNAGIAACRSEIIAFIDDDAVAQPDWLNRIELAFLRDPAIGIVGGSIRHLARDPQDLVSRYFDLVAEK